MESVIVIPSTVGDETFSLTEIVTGTDVSGPTCEPLRYDFSFTIAFSFLRPDIALWMVVV